MPFFLSPLFYVRIRVPPLLFVAMKINYNTITATDKTVVHRPCSPTVAEVDILNVSLGFESVHVSYMLDARRSA